MEFQIRQCEIADAKAVYELNVKEMGYDYPNDKTEEKLKRLLKSGACGVRLVSGTARTGAHEFYRRCEYGGDKQRINFKKML